MNPLGKLLSLALCSLASLCLSPMLSQAEDLRPSELKSTCIIRYSDSLTSRNTPKHSILLKEIGHGLPLLGIGVAYTLYNEPVKRLRHAHLPSFHNRYDDYLQFSPLALQMAMRLSGVRGASHSLNQMLLSDALASGVMLSVVYGVKTASRVLRPDGSSHNSFPSGHTAMAFTAATLLHQEYGVSYPWLSALSYTAASAVGVGRILNNRHWVGDVVTGAALGYLSGKLGYWLSDLIYRSKRVSTYSQPSDLLTPNLSIYIPMAYSSESHNLSPSSSLRTEYFCAGLGIHWAYNDKGYFVRNEVGSEVNRLTLRHGTKHYEGQTKTLSLSASWGYTWHLVKDYLTLEADIGLRLRVPKVARSLENYTLTTQTSIAPSVRLSPLWQITPHVALRLDAKTEYTPQSEYLRGNDIDYPFSLPRWSIGSSLAFRL